MPPKPNENFDYASLKVIELKALLKEKGLSVYGKKAELVKRLKDADAIIIIQKRNIFSYLGRNRTFVHFSFPNSRYIVEHVQ